MKVPSTSFSPFSEVDREVFALHLIGTRKESSLSVLAAVIRRHEADVRLARCGFQRRVMICSCDRRKNLDANKTPDNPNQGQILYRRAHKSPPRLRDRYMGGGGGVEIFILSAVQK